MDFIEQWLGLSPDGGNGSVEILYLLALAMTVGAVFWRWKKRRRHRRSV